MRRQQTFEVISDNLENLKTETPGSCGPKLMVFFKNLLASPNFPPSIISFLLMFKRKTVLEGSVLLMFTKEKLQRKAGEWIYMPRRKHFSNRAFSIVKFIPLSITWTQFPQNYNFKSVYLNLRGKKYCTGPKKNGKAEFT